MWHAFILCESDVKFMNNSKQNYYPHWKDLAIAIMETGPQLQGRTRWKEEARVIEKLSRVKVLISP